VFVQDGDGCVYVDWYCVYIWISGFDGCVVRLVLSGYDYDDSWIYLAMFEVILIVVVDIFCRWVVMFLDSKM